MTLVLCAKDENDLLGESSNCACHWLNSAQFGSPSDCPTLQNWGRRARICARSTRHALSAANTSRASTAVRARPECKRCSFACRLLAVCETRNAKPRLGEKGSDYIPCGYGVFKYGARRARSFEGALPVRPPMAMASYECGALASTATDTQRGRAVSNDSEIQIQIRAGFQCSQMTRCKRCRAGAVEVAR